MVETGRMSWRFVDDVCSVNYPDDSSARLMRVTFQSGQD